MSLYEWLYNTILDRGIWKKINSLAKKSEHQDFFFVQIGACDGITQDPIYDYVKKYKWKGILVEPLKHHFQKLVENYNGTPGLIFENFAIAEKSGTKKFYYFPDNRWYLRLLGSRIGSFLPEVISKHRIRWFFIKDKLIEEEVNCLSFQDLLEKHSVKKVDFLVIDTEGYDDEIIKQINFEKISPKVILYEHKHLGPYKEKECRRLLEGKGYILERKLLNTLARIV